MCLANGVIADPVVQQQCQPDAVLIRVAVRTTDQQVQQDELLPIEGKRFAHCAGSGNTRQLLRRSNVPDNPPDHVNEPEDVDLRAPTWDSDNDDDMSITYVDNKGRGIRLA